jgi:beta-glucanase (GH16 family)
MQNFIQSLFLLTLSISQIQAQNITDDFEGNGNITSWLGDDCEINTNLANPYPTGINTSSTVLRYSDNGGLYANVRFQTETSFNLTSNNVFRLKIYVPSSGITGNQPNQVSLKLQNGNLAEPWSTQCEIIKPIVLNQWQTISFDFQNDNYVNLNGGSGNPIYRSDFNRVVIQINGENNTNQVIAYIDDFLYENPENSNPVFDNLVWSDEFDGNGAVNATKWYHQTQIPDGGSWFNGEIQHYTNRLTNSFISNGNLNIVAKRENYTDQNVTKEFTSARLNSKFAFKYGRVEVRAKLPSGTGTWPAIWMLGKNVNEPGGFWAATHGTVGWPACGEIDIMEHWGNNQNFVQSAMHTPSSFGNTVNHAGRVISTVSSEFHVYTLEWTAEKMVFSVDNIIHYIYNPTIKNANTWPFDAEQYLLLNFAVQPNISSSFNQGTFEIDYVRVYQQSSLSTPTAGAKKKVSLIPNPAKNKLTIQFDEIQTNNQITIYSMQGQELSSFQMNSEKETIDISNFSNGIYIVNITDEKGSFTSRFVKD